MRSKLLNLDVAEQAFDIVFRYAEDSGRDIYLLGYMKYCVFNDDDVHEYVEHLSAIERGEETLWTNGAEFLVLSLRPDGATIVFRMDDHELPPRHYTLKEIRDALEDWRDYLRERAQEKESQGA